MGVLATACMAASSVGGTACGAPVAISTALVMVESVSKLTIGMAAPELYFSNVTMASRAACPLGMFALMDATTEGSLQRTDAPVEPQRLSPR